MRTDREGIGGERFPAPLEAETRLGASAGRPRRLIPRYGILREPAVSAG